MKAGYKLTMLGMIPSDWEVRTLESIADKIMVGIASAATHAYRSKGVPMIRNQNIKSGYLDADDLLFIDPGYETTFKNKRLRSGDLLTARTGYPGTTCIVPAQFDSAQSFTTLITRPRGNDIESSYLCHFINSEEGQRFFLQGQIGGAQKNVNAGTLRGMLIPVPPVLEQRAIAEALSDVDALIESLDRLIAKKCDIKQAAMQQLLTGQRRLPGFSGEWEVKRFEDFGSCLRGVSYRGDSDLFAHDTNSSVRLFRSNNVKNGVVVTADLQYVSRDRVSESQFMRQDDILVCMANGSKDLVGKSGRFDLLDGYQYTFGAFMGVFRTENTKADPSYVFFLFQTAEYRRRINDLLAGSSINNLRPSSIESLEVRVPPRPEQLAIAGVLKDIEAELAAVEQRRDKTRTLKQGMMQELLTGRTRLV